MLCPLPSSPRCAVAFWVSAPVDELRCGESRASRALHASRAHAQADDANEDFAYVGHGIEVAWMLMAEAKRREDTALYSRAADLFKRSVQVAKVSPAMCV